MTQTTVLAELLRTLVPNRSFVIVAVRDEDVVFVVRQE
jgi:hypothetical protein